MRTSSRRRSRATRASKSCFLTLCEGLPNDSVPMRRKYFTMSRNSLHELVGAMDLAEATAVQEFAFRLRRMLGALLR